MIKMTEKEKKNYAKRDASEYNWFRTLFQILVCRIGYMIRFKLIYKLKIEGLENIPKDNDYIVCPNHLSTLDPPLMCAVFPRRIAFMAKKELFDIKFIRWWIDWLGAFSVNRESLSPSTIKTVLGLKKTKWAFGIFPQGTRGIPGEIKNVSKGFAGLAKLSKRNVLPVGIVGSEKATHLPFSGQIIVRIGKPIPYSDNIDEVREKWIGAIQELTGFKYIETSEDEVVDKDKTNQKNNVRNYNRRYPNEYNWFRTLFYWCFLMFVIDPFMAIFYDCKVTGRENIAKRKKTDRLIYTGNHVSHFDPPMLTMACRRPIAYMAKKELFEKGDKFEWLVKRLGAFAVDRNKPEIATFKTVKDILSTSWSLGIFPQGGIRPYGKLEDIKVGFVKIAKYAKADIVPVAISEFNGYPKLKPFTRRKVRLHVGTPISYKLPEDVIIYEWCKQISEHAEYENCAPIPESYRSQDLLNS